VTTPPLRPWPADRVERWPLERIKPYPRNARSHSPEQIRKIADSMLTWGVTAPVLVDEEGVLLYGHGRRAAAALLVREGRPEFGTLPVAIARGWSEDEKAAYRLADNQLALLSTWDEGALRAEMAELGSSDLIPLIGFGEADLNRLSSPSARRTADPDAAAGEPPPPERRVSAIGDLWLLGEHRLICASATDPEAWQHLTRGMHGLAAAMVFTDPPYGVSYGAGTDTGFAVIAGDEKRSDDLYRMLVAALLQMAAHTTDRAAFYIWHASATRNDFAQALTAAGLLERQYLIWAKPSIALGWADYKYAHESCFYASKAAHSPMFHGEANESTVWRIASIAAAGTAAVIGTGIVILDGKGGTLAISPKAPKGKKLREIRLTSRSPTVHLAGAEGSSSVWEIGRDRDYVHPTQKPVELARRAIENSSRPGEIVLDAFMGSGTTMIAAEMTGRRTMGMDIDPGYVDVAIARWQAFTGTAAVHATSGRTFAQEARERGIIEGERADVGAPGQALREAG
jgi:DNA modification methylase